MNRPINGGPTSDKEVSACIPILQALSRVPGSTYAQRTTQAVCKLFCGSKKVFFFYIISNEKHFSKVRWVLYNFYASSVCLICCRRYRGAHWKKKKKTCQQFVVFKSQCLVLVYNVVCIFFLAKIISKMFHYQLFLFILKRLIVAAMSLKEHCKLLITFSPTFGFKCCH